MPKKRERQTAVCRSRSDYPIKNGCYASARWRLYASSSMTAATSIFWSTG